VDFCWHKLAGKVPLRYDSGSHVPGKGTSNVQIVRALCSTIGGYARVRTDSLRFIEALASRYDCHLDPVRRGGPVCGAGSN
jgi:hypothetical protein